MRRKSQGSLQQLISIAELLIFTAQPRVFGSQIFRHRFWDAPRTAGRLKSIDEPCAMKPPALELLPGTRGASTYFPPRCGPLQDGPHGPLHPGQIFSACSRFSHLLKRNKTWDTSNSVPETAHSSLSGDTCWDALAKFIACFLKITFQLLTPL